MNHVSEYITDTERLEAIRYGAAMELADRGITVSQFDGILKSAQTAPTLSLGDIFKTALIFGIPAGTLAYVVHKSLKKGSKKTRKLQKELDYYNTVASELKNNLGDYA